MATETPASAPAGAAATVTTKTTPPAPGVVTKIVQGKVGQPGQPTVAEWDLEILADLRVALGKIAQSPTSKYTQLARLIRANLR